MSFAKCKEYKIQTNKEAEDSDIGKFVITCGFLALCFDHECVLVSIFYYNNNNKSHNNLKLTKHQLLVKKSLLQRHAYIKDAYMHTIFLLHQQP